MIHAYLRTLIMYLLLLGTIRLLGKRQVGQLAPSEFVVTMMAANLATGSIEDPEATPVYGIIAIVTILAAELTLSWLTLGSLPMRRLLCGRPVILMENGRLVQENLRRTRITLDELTGRLRGKGVLELSAVQYAILETNGELSVFLNPGERPATAAEAGIPAKAGSLPVTLIEDGKVLQDNLKRAGRTRDWLRAVLRERQGSTENTLLLTVTGENHISYIRKEGT